MYFAVLGKNTEISMTELQLVQPSDISHPKKGIVIFDTQYPELLKQLGGCIKSGIVVKEKELQTLLSEVKIIGIQNEANGKHLKKTAGIRRYKLVDLFHTDKEIKNKGKEIINLESGLYGIVEYYQNIELYEVIDFSKPGRSMQMGMMPAKLTHILINIGLSTIDYKLSAIYDPFVGSGTTGMLANHFGYDFIGSDIQTKYAEQNAKRWKTTKFSTDNEFSLFTHDITKPFGQIGKKTEKSDKNISSNSSSDFSEHFLDSSAILIVTEGRLGPIVKKTTSEEDIQKFQERVTDLYKNFFDRIKELQAVAVFTIPRYIGQENGVEKILMKYAAELGLQINSIPELYSREGQQVARKILIITLRDK